MRKEIKKAPTIRFRGFTDDWKQRKVGEFYDFKNGLNKDKEFFGTGVPIVNFTDVFHNRGLTASQLEGRVTLEPNEIKNYSVEKGDIFFTRTSETIEEIGYPSVMLDTPENTVFSGFVLRGRCFSGNDPFDNLFKQYVFFTQSFRDEMKKKSSMTTRALTSGTSIKEMLFQFPSSKNEQHQIGKCITKFDDLITIHQRKLDQLKKLKKYFLQNMFPAKGEKVPRIRFKGFTGDWEQRKLGDVLVLLKDGTHGTHKDAESGPLLLSAKNIKDGTVHWDESDRRISEDEYNSIHTNFQLQKGDVLLTIVGSIGETAILSQSQGVTFQRSVAFLRPSDEISSEFLYSEIQGQKFQKELIDRKSTSAQPGIYLGDLGAIPIEFPTSDEEQTKVGRYFRNLDHLITLHQRKLNQLLTMKKFMLQNLFI